MVRFIQKIKTLSVSAILDVDCGSGAFGLGLIDYGYSVLGIDISQKMVENSLKAGLNARHIDICDLNGEFDAATAVFDVLNYLDRKNLANFSHVSKKI